MNQDNCDPCAETARPVETSTVGMPKPDRADLWTPATRDFLLVLMSLVLGALLLACFRLFKQARAAAWDKKSTKFVRQDELI